MSSPQGEALRHVSVGKWSTGRLYTGWCRQTQATRSTEGVTGTPKQTEFPLRKPHMQPATAQELTLAWVSNKHGDLCNMPCWGNRMYPLFLPLLIRHGLLIMRPSELKGSGSHGLCRDIGRPHRSSLPWIEAFPPFHIWEGGGRGGACGEGREFFRDILNDFSCWQKGRKGFQNKT